MATPITPSSKQMPRRFLEACKTTLKDQDVNHGQGPCIGVPIGTHAKKKGSQKVHRHLTSETHKAETCRADVSQLSQRMTYLHADDAVASDDVAGGVRLAITFEPDAMALAVVLIDEVGQEEALIGILRHNSILGAVDMVLNDIKLQDRVGPDASLDRHEVAVVHLDAFDPATLNITVDVDTCKHSMNDWCNQGGQKALDHLVRTH